MRLLFHLCLLACVLFVMAERTAQRKRNHNGNAISRAVQVSATRHSNHYHNGALIKRGTTAVRRAVPRSRSALTNKNKRRSVRSRSRAVVGRRVSRPRLAKQEESDLEQNPSQGFGEEQSSVDGSGETSGNDAAGTGGVQSANQPSNEATDLALSGSDVPLSNGGDASTSNVVPVATPDASSASVPSNPAAALPAIGGTSPQNAAGFGGFPGNFKFPSFPGNGAVGAGFAQSQGPGIAFGAGFATSNGRQSTSGGFGAAFSAPNFGSNDAAVATVPAQPAASQPATEAPVEEELSQIRRRPIR